MNHRRSQMRRLRACADLAVCAVGSTDAAALETVLLLPKVIVAIESLPAGERAALLLSVLEEMSYEDIAVALAIPVGTVRSRIHRARQRLQMAVNGGAHEAQ
jgi:RNA polymerase sigma-70 factor (ECF subfamily)